MADPNIEEMLNHIAANPHDHVLKMVVADMADEADKPQTATALRYMGQNEHAPSLTRSAEGGFSRPRNVWAWMSPASDRASAFGANHVVPQELLQVMPLHGQPYRVPHNEISHGYEDNTGGSAYYAGDSGLHFGGYDRAEYPGSRDALNAYLLGHAKMMQNQSEEDASEKAITDLLLKSE